MKGTTQWRLPICAVTGTKDDENIGAQELHSGASGNEPQQQQQSMHGLLTVNSPRSSSLLIHAALKVFTWAKVNIFAESREVPATVADQTQASTPAKRRRGHQRTHVLDILGWLILGLIAYALVVWTKLAFANRLMHFAWTKYHAFELRTKSDADREPPVCLKRFDDSTKRLDRDTFMEVGKLIGKERSEVEWEKQRPKWTLDNIERYSLFKSHIP
ncbi:hypothetical protein GGI01_003564 [Coemansia sp. RSA 376]|nr:hypothetical protein GGI01_003564 [Coemansia sp. RSA 376]